MDTDYWICRVRAALLAAVAAGLMLLAMGVPPAHGRWLADAHDSWRKPPTPMPLQVSAARNQATAGYYRVQPGDTLWSIARTNGLTAEELAAANRLTLQDTIFAGQYLEIPGPQEKRHRVRQGETLWRIAGVYGVEMNQIIASNSLTRPGHLFVGQELSIPESEISRRAAAPVASRSGGRMTWPVAGVITSLYGPRSGGFHHGLDIAAKTGQPVRAAAAGEVVFSGWRNSTYGRAIIVDHAGGFTTLYAHNSINLVQVGDYVQAGQIIAQVGTTGRATGPHVHFEVYQAGKTVDPLRFLQR
ncbi:MAG: peptidoglycan DD-metalloendopeptidase family protein [Bacillota bacterium]